MKLVHMKCHVNHKTQPFWVKLVHLVPNVNILAGHAAGAISCFLSFFKIKTYWKKSEIWLRTTLGGNWGHWACGTLVICDIGHTSGTLNRYWGHWEEIGDIGQKLGDIRQTYGTLGRHWAEIGVLHISYKTFCISHVR